MDKISIAYSHNEILFSHKKYEVLIHATVYMKLESIMSSKKKKGKKDHMLYNSIYMKYQKQVDL